MKKSMVLSESEKKEIKDLKKARQIHSTWYRDTYPDVAISGIDPAEHYIKYGSKMGRSPRKDFDVKYYINNYPEVLESNLTPVMHYEKVGKLKGYRKAPLGARKSAENEVKIVKNKLLSLGLSVRGLQDMKVLAEKASDKYQRFYASREVALWYMRNKKEGDYREALQWLEISRDNAFDHKGICTINTAFLICYYQLSEVDMANLLYKDALKNESLDDNVKLAFSNFSETIEEKLKIINNVLFNWSLAPLKTLNSSSLSIYDQLTTKSNLPLRYNGPKVTVLMATYNAENTISTALRSLKEQTFQNIEILVIDDCSSDNTQSVVEDFSRIDSRVRYIKMKENLGAYVARNFGLDIAEGKYITLHDADDWSHPQKIQLQLEYLEENNNVIGCTSEQARAFSDLSFTRWTGPCHFIISNTSSFMFRRDKVKEYAGYWDTVRFSADNELIRRLQKIFGKHSIQHLRTGPLSFQRDSHTSIIADEILGINGFLFGARKEYHDAQRYYHFNAENLKFTGEVDVRPFSVPKVMKPRRESETERYLDVIICGDFRKNDSSTESAINLIKNAQKANEQVGVVQQYSYDLVTDSNAMNHFFRKFLYENNIEILTYGESVVCKDYHVINSKILSSEQKYKVDVSYHNYISHEIV